VDLPWRQDVGWVGARCVALRLVLELLTPLLQHAGYGVVTKDLLRHNGSAGFDNYADVICTAYPLFDKASQRWRGQALCHEIHCATVQLASVNW
jgi:hypothetical protein